MRVFLGSFIIRILLFRVLYEGLFGVLYNKDPTT